jgi:protease secretion system membrane fusion protein
MNVQTIRELFTGKSRLQGKSGQRDTHRPIRFGIWVLLVGFGGFLLWATFAPLDEGVPCQGIISIATKRKVIQHLQGGIVQAVHVQEGQMVRRGDPLISLDSLTAKARYQEVHQNYLGLRAEESRLLAEQRGQSRIEFHEDLRNDPNRELVEQLMKNEKQLLVSRQSVLHLLNGQLSGMRSLVREGYAPRNQQIDLEKRVAELRAEMATEMVRVQREVDASAEKSKALAEDLRNTHITSPVSGQVVGLLVQTVGAVIQPGQKLMDIVPMDESLLIEVKVAPHLIDRIHSGLFADVRFASFANSPQLVVKGRVESVSKDLLSDPQVNPSQPASPYYLARISITPEGLRTLGRHQLQPGMPVQAIIKTGERSLLTYLLHPLIKRISASMKEE